VRISQVRRLKESGVDICQWSPSRRPILFFPILIFPAKRTTKMDQRWSKNHRSGTYLDGIEYRFAAITG